MTRECKHLWDTDEPGTQECVKCGVLQIVLPAEPRQRRPK